jgi:hypothetical protein
MQLCYWRNDIKRAVLSAEDKRFQELQKELRAAADQLVFLGLQQDFVRFFPIGN